MKFGPVDVAASEGAVLAHKIVLPERVLQKGHVLTVDDVVALKAESVSEVVVAQLGAEDVSEDQAAKQISDVLTTDEIASKPAFTGRANFYATCAGVFQANRQSVDDLNGISPDMTLATLDDGVFVEAGRMVGTVKIIPFAVPKTALNQAILQARSNAVISIQPSKPFNVGLIATKLPSLKPSTMDKTTNTLQTRLKAAGSSLTDEMRVAHNVRELSSAMRVMVNRTDLIVVFGASAITDKQDIIPASLEAAGGKVIRLGMPVDPGNLLMIGELDGKPVIGAPGCARSPAENGFDWVLQRLLAQLPVDDNYISGLGVGGLLMEITSRPQPREG